MGALPSFLSWSLLELLVLAIMILLLPGLAFSFQFDSQGILAYAARQWFAAIVFGIILIIYALEQGLLSKILQWRMFVIGGEISFSLYLLHQIFLGWQARNPWALGWLPPAFRVSCFIVCMLGVSFVVWRFVERPSRFYIMKSSKNT